jgi:hypothetical protein
VTICEVISEYLRGLQMLWNRFHGHKIIPLVSYGWGYDAVSRRLRWTGDEHVESGMEGPVIVEKSQKKSCGE